MFAMSMSAGTQRWAGKVEGRPCSLFVFARSRTKSSSSQGAAACREAEDRPEVAAMTSLEEWTDSCKEGNEKQKPLSIWMRLQLMKVVYVADACYSLRAYKHLYHLACNHRSTSMQHLLLLDLDPESSCHWWQLGSQRPSQCTPRCSSTSIHCKHETPIWESLKNEK